jgi:hypothetical protein
MPLKCNGRSSLNGSRSANQLSLTLVIEWVPSGRKSGCQNGRGN